MRLQTEDPLNRYAFCYFRSAHCESALSFKFLLPLLFVLLRRHLLLVKMCTTVSLDPLELPSSWENICQVLNIVNDR